MKSANIFSLGHCLVCPKVICVEFCLELAKFSRKWVGSILMVSEDVCLEFFLKLTILKVLNKTWRSGAFKTCSSHLFLWWWEAYCPKLLNVILHVAYFLSPDSFVQNHAKDHSISKDRNAAESPIKKWLIPEDVVGNFYFKCWQISVWSFGNSN